MQFHQSAFHVSVHSACGQVAATGAQAPRATTSGLLLVGRYGRSGAVPFAGTNWRDAHPESGSGLRLLDQS